MARTEGAWKYKDHLVYAESGGATIPVARTVSRLGTAHSQAEENRLKAQERANGALLAAAPEMLKALKAVEWVYRDGESVCPGCEHIYPNHAANCGLDAALALVQGGE